MIFDIEPPSFARTRERALHIVNAIPFRPHHLRLPGQAKDARIIEVSPMFQPREQPLIGDRAVLVINLICAFIVKFEKLLAVRGATNALE